MLSIEGSPMPPRFTGNRACRRARLRCASEPDSDPTILWKAAAIYSTTYQHSSRLFLCITYWTVYFEANTGSLFLYYVLRNPARIGNPD